MSCADGLVANGTIAQDHAQSQAIWQVREGITGALSKSGAVYKYDVSIPLAELYSLCEVMRSRLEPVGALVTGFGHLGDGNLHLNIYTPGVFEKSTAVHEAIEPFVYEWIAERRGSISAEHGCARADPPALLHPAQMHPSCCMPPAVPTQSPAPIDGSCQTALLPADTWDGPRPRPCLIGSIGVMKPEFLHMSKTAPMIDLMHGLKDLLDPNGILNPYKVLPRR